MSNTTVIQGHDGTSPQRIKVTSAGVQEVAQSGTWSVTTTPAAATTGGYTPGKLVSAGSTNATVIKASAGTLGYLAASNVNAAVRYLKLYNKATAPTVGTDVPVATFVIPGSTTGGGTNIPLPPQGIAFSTGISFALTTEATDAGTTGISANETVVNYGYK